MELSQRDKEILEILISDYISTAAPVGSGTIAKRYTKHLSAATVRNVMADLEDAGLLTHPHTSAGRVPTPVGLRYYVDTILKKRSLNQEEMTAIEERYGQMEKGVENVIKKTANILSAISNYAGLIVTPVTKKIPLKHIEFIKLSSNRLLGIVVTMLGEVQNRIIEVNEDLNYIELEKINNYCSRYVTGLTFDEAKSKVAKDLQNEQLKYDKFLSKALMCAGNVLRPKDDVEMYVEGEARILSEPEFSDLGKAKQVLEALEEKKNILHVIEQTMKTDGVKIFIGKEIGITGVDECSLITASYKENGEPIGTLGVIGPMRMDYSKIISVVDFTSKLLSDILEGR